MTQGGSPLEHGPRRITVLVADDETMLQKMLCDVLAVHGFHVLSADNGKEALDAAAQYSDSIDLLISDVQMPVMTGPDLARQLQILRPELKVMLISAYPLGELVLDRGWRFVQKPFLPNALLQEICNMLDQPPTPDARGRAENG